MPRTNDLATTVAESLVPHLQRLQDLQMAQPCGPPARAAWVAGAAEVIREVLADFHGWRPCGCSEAERPECEWCGGEGVLVTWGPSVEGQADG